MMGKPSLPDIVDNAGRRKLGDILGELVSNEGASLHIATAYFNLGAFVQLKEALRKAKRVRLLLGREPERKFALGEKLWEELQEGLMRGEPQLPLQIREWLDFLRQPNVEVRRFTKGFLHGKAYIVEGVPVVGSVGIVGSSNFTAAGLTENYELNAVLKQEAAVGELKGWFERFWEEAEDYKGELQEILARFTAEYTPYEVYVRILYEYFSDQLEVEPAPTDGGPSPIALTDFQHDGYLAAKDILERYGGVLIADSVGLGKTYLALRLLDDYAYRLRQKALIICPAQIRDTLWEPKLRDYGIRADIESMERVSRNFPLDEYADYDLVVVDESHNFRNNETNRWQNLFELLRRGNPEKKLILLTATPVNNTVFDLYNQLLLITKGREDFFAPAGIRNLKNYFKRAEENRETLYEVLEAIAVRRSRKFIKEHYPDAQIDGRPVRFPERRLHTVRYSLERCFQGFYERVARTIERLNLAPYQIDLYRKEVIRALGDAWREAENLEKVGRALEGRGGDGDIQKLMLDIGRQRALAAIMRILYLKRLESSVEALRISIRRQMEFQRRFLEALGRGRLLDATSYRRLFLQQEGSDEASEEADLQRTLEQLPQVDAELYDIEAIRRDVEEDIRALEEIDAVLAQLHAENDVKLRELKRLLTGELRGRKLVVFTYFKDTARYLWRQLREDGEVLEAFGPRGISITDSGIPPQDRKRRIVQFAPVASGRGDLPREEQINLLVSTDVLSEGQNLQDADTVINYDLHWNPIRMVQRVGRIDRIGSPHDVVHVYNFVPEDALESLLRLMQRLYEKLEAIKKTVGLDASVLGERPAPKDFNMIRRIAREDESVWADLEGESELDIGEWLKRELLNYIEEVGKERLERMPLGLSLGAGKPGRGRRGLFAAFREEGTGKHFWCFYDLEADRIYDSKLEAVRFARSKPTERRVEPDFDVHKIVAKLRRHIYNRLRQIAHRQPRLYAPQNHIVQWLQALPRSERREELLEYFRKPLPGVTLPKLRKLWREVGRGSLSDGEILARLAEFAEENPHPPTPSPEVPEVREEDIRLVGWIALV